MYTSGWAHRSEETNRNWEQEVAGKRGGNGIAACEGDGREDKQERRKSREQEGKLKGGKGESIRSIAESVLTLSQGSDDL